MAIKNETLRNKIEAKRKQLMDKIAPLQEELDMVNNMLKPMDEYDTKNIQAAEKNLGLNNGGEE